MKGKKRWPGRAQRKGNGGRELRSLTIKKKAQANFKLVCA